MQLHDQPNSDRSPQALGARLRALPPVPVPTGLEARLLSAIPPGMAGEHPNWSRRSRSRHLAVWAGAAVALAAACLLAVLLWPKPGDKSTPDMVVLPERSATSHRLKLPRQGDSASITPWLEVRRGLDGAEVPAFSWPIEAESRVMVSLRIPSDLFD
jgi:hypothetical protein